VLHDVGDGTETDVLPPGRHQPNLSRTQRRASGDVAEQIRHGAIDRRSRVPACHHVLLMRRSGHDGGAAHHVQHGRDAPVAFSGQFEQRPDRYVHDQLERVDVDRGEPVRTRCLVFERIPCDHEQAQRIGETSVLRRQLRPLHPQLQQLLPGEGRLGKKPPYVIRQTGQMITASAGHVAESTHGEAVACLPVRRHCFVRPAR
jgi:hypothetical protein